MRAILTVAAAIAAFLATLMAPIVVMDYAVLTSLRCRGVPENQSPEALTDLTLMVLMPLVFPFLLIAAEVAAGFAAVALSRRLDPNRDTAGKG